MEPSLRFMGLFENKLEMPLMSLYLQAGSFAPADATQPSVPLGEAEGILEAVVERWVELVRQAVQVRAGQIQQGVFSLVSEGRGAVGIFLCGAGRGSASAGFGKAI